MLFPIDWPEPFGLVMIEAMACGTPVIAFRSGSVPEVIDDGITGFVVPGEAEAIAAIGRLSELDRREVRMQFEKRFTAKRMAQDYLRRYEALVHPGAREVTPASKNGPSAGGEPRPSSQRVPSGGPAQTYNRENCHLFPIRAGFDRRLSPP